MCELLWNASDKGRTIVRWEEFYKGRDALE